MSTSPSWFDQEKFSRLVKKVGPKTLTEPLPSPHGTDPENRPPSGEGLAPTARISLVSKPPSLLAEQRALPALPRRTAPLPSIKALFSHPTPPNHAPSGEAASQTSPGGGAHEAEPKATLGRDGEEDLAEIWQKMGLLNEELARAILDRDQAINEGQILREQLRQADEAIESRESAAEPTEKLARVTKERDAAIAELQSLREQAIKKLDTAKDLRAKTQSQGLTLLTEERDRSRKEYTALRKEYEDLKQEQTSRERTQGLRVDLGRQLDELRQKLAERDKEISALKAKAGSGGGAGVAGGGDEKLKVEVVSLREELARVKDEASVAQRGLALSQKALHETRDTLREATEGTSLSRHNFDNLKNECAMLAQQNTVLQAQNDQLTRDLAAAKSKLTTRL
jgi:DNA repair exonuclease SbcCD ATPase subunit